ncbi:MAG: indole-3-glycerol phosphate synthase TrpC [Candidatus Omnitrophica bacterium]|nr:indole-3-glycerol phosphate synthase TrpC [Candidatus Omnitrophota bacterium]
MILNEIVQQKKRDLEEIKRRFPPHRLRKAVEHLRPSEKRSFSKALSNPKRLNIICELKKASPSEGVIREDFQPLRIASIYEHAGAAALSVLTEPHFFKGRPSYLKTVRQVTTIPLLRKDFIFETYQLYETALLEADAFLLIACLLTEDELRLLISLGRELGMEALVEIHADEDLKKALDAGASIVGINNRNLKTLDIDMNRSRQLLPRIPKGVIKVVESGLSGHEQLISYKGLGADAFLIGTAFMKSPDILASVESFLGTDRKWKKAEGV